MLTSEVPGHPLEDGTDGEELVYPSKSEIKEETLTAWWTRS